MHARTPGRVLSNAEHAAQPPHAHLDGLRLHAWAVGIARGVRSDFHFEINSAEEDELESVALFTMVELMHRFDEVRLPAGGEIEAAFKGYADAEIRSRCRRHALTLRNGGTFRTTSSKEAKKLRVQPLPVCRDCGDVALPWPERGEDEEEELDEYDRAALAREPNIVWLKNGVPKDQSGAA